MGNSDRYSVDRVFQAIERFRSPLMIAGLVLLGFYAILRNLLERVEFGRLTPQGSTLILHTILQYVFIIALVTVVTSVIAYLLPKVIPKDWLIRPAQLYFGVAVFRMIDPMQSPLSRLLQEMEHYPGFPYYSRESDHPSAWPPRVFADRDMLWKSYEAFFQDPDVRSRLASDSSFKANTVKLISSGSPDRSGQVELNEYVSAARYHLLQLESQGEPALIAVLGEERAWRFVEIEHDRKDIHEYFPNRLAVVRLHNFGRRDVLNLGIELEVAGLVYDCVIDADSDKVRKSVWDRDAQRVSFERLPSGYTAQVRVWYQYQSVSEKVFPDKINYIHELTQGVRIANIAASRTDVRYNAALLEDFTGYERLYFGDARKKDSYDDELRPFFKERNKKMAEHMKRYDELNPTLSDLPPAKLIDTGVLDSQVTSVWLGFRSPGGKRYDAVHVFAHPHGPYILIASKDCDRADIKLVCAKIAAEYEGIAKDEVATRSDDICMTVGIPGGLSQTGIARVAADLAVVCYTELLVSKFHYEIKES
jgi:hypothetical protein